MLPASLPHSDVEDNGAPPPPPTPVFGRLEAALRRRISKVGTRVIDLFRAWDADDSGGIDKREFREAMRKLSEQEGLEPALPDDEVDAFFQVTDADHNGTIEFCELNRALRPGSSITLDAEMLAGAHGAIATKAENTFALRTSGLLRRSLARFSGSYKLQDKSKKSLVKQLSDTIRRNKLRAYDFFRDWDADHNGSLQRDEFRAAILAMGFSGDDASIESAFDEIDLDKNGNIGLRELEKALQRYFEVDMAPGISYEFRADSRSPRSLLLELRLNRTGASSPPPPVGKNSVKDVKRGGAAAKSKRGRRSKDKPEEDLGTPTCLVSPDAPGEGEDPMAA